MRAITMGALAAWMLAGLAWAEDTMPWQANLETAQRLAGQTNRLVVLHFWGPHCPPCVKVEREVFSQAETGRALDANFVAVKLNVDEFPSTARLYGVTRIPTDVILTPSGQVVSKLQSPLDAGQYVAALNQVAEGRRRARNVQPVAATAPIDYGASSQAPSYPSSAGYARSSDAPVVEMQPPAQPLERQSRWGGSESARASMPANTQSASPTNVPVEGSTTWPRGGATAASPGTGVTMAAGTASNYGAPAGGDYRGQLAAVPAQAPAGANPYLAVAPPMNATPGGAYVGVGSSTAPPLARPSTSPSSPGVQLPPGSPPLVLDGHCPVTLLTSKRWQRGDVRYGAVHRGRTYIFASPTEQQQFLANPDAYMPMLSGDDPVMAIDHGQQVPGQRKFGAFYQKRVYLFSSEETMNRFTKSPDRYVSVVLQAMNTR